MGRLNAVAVIALLALALLGGAAEAAKHAPKAAKQQAPAAHGLVSDAARFRSNLSFMRQRLLPKDWDMWAVMKWEAYGHGLAELAEAAVDAASGIAVLSNREIEAVVNAVGSVPPLLRIYPTNYTEMVEAAARGWNVQEFVTPDNLEDVGLAAADAGANISVHLYLFKHYSTDLGWFNVTAADLLGIIDNLPPGVQLAGIMMHVNGYPDEQKEGVLADFFSAVCPVAAELAARGRRLAVHWADSFEVLRLIPDNGFRLAMPANACPGATNINWGARMGALSYGMYRELNELFPGMKPVLRWDAQVARVTHEANRTLAVVELPSSGGRYPAPTWLQGEPSDAEQEEGLSAAPAAAIPVPPAYQALVHGKPFGAVPLGEGRQIHLDVTGATPAVKAGDHVCLLCDQHTVYDLAEAVGADDYNVALCMRGWEPVEGVEYEAPLCLPQVPSGGATLLPGAAALPEAPLLI